MAEYSHEDREIVELSVKYLVGDRRNSEARDAWDTLWNGEWEPEEHFAAIADLVSRVPHDDDTLWMVADGPVSMLLVSPEGAALLEHASESDPVMRRVLELTRVP